ncbi:uncharacterized protein B0I36DRAFT_381456, partial [Microdochium trichocladiopsis]
MVRMRKRLSAVIKRPLSLVSSRRSATTTMGSSSSCGSDVGGGGVTPRQQHPGQAPADDD